MNPWDILWVITGWIFLVFVVLGSAIVIFAVLIGIWRGISRWSPAARAKEEHNKDSLERYMLEATAVSKGAYKDELLMTDELVSAFKDGALWGWGYHSRKKA